tara:strand:- start:5439 stop:5705 length:267 start_codon:yes stop_codon:yes gene_type:complete
MPEQNQDSLIYIQQLEGDLRAVVEMRTTAYSDIWLLLIQLSYKNDLAGTTSFNLHGYSRKEAEEIAKNIQSNPYVMKEIDEYLWGESD